MAATALLAVGLAAATPGLAWKPYTHLYLAEEALRDALEDGKVTIRHTEYELGVLTERVVGHYAVDPATLAALRAAPRQFRAGVIGPDAYPDIMTGQMIIHPNSNQYGGSDAWLRHLWQQAHRDGFDTPQIRAFVIGYIFHATGDMYAHTLVNHFSGGDFEIGENGLRHVLLEGYMGKRTPADFKTWDGAVAVGPDQIDITGVEEFIYRTLILAEPGEIGPDNPGAWLFHRLVQPASAKWNDVSSYPIPVIFSYYRAELQKDTEEMVATLRNSDNEIYRRFCAPGIENCLEQVREAWLAAGRPAERFVPRAFNRQIYDIEEGLKALPQISHRNARAILAVKPGQEDWDAVQQAVSDYAGSHMVKMFGVKSKSDVMLLFGAPPSAATLVDISDQMEKAFMALPEALRERVQVIDDTLDRWKWEALLYASTGMTLQDISDYHRNPPLFFRDVLSKTRQQATDNIRQRGGALWDLLQQQVAGAGLPEVPVSSSPVRTVTLEAFNRDVLRIEDEAYDDPDEYYDVTRFRAAHNTVTMTKLVLLGRSELERLLSDLGVNGYRAPQDNVMLGFLSSMDGDNLWHRNHRSFAIGRTPQERAAYRMIFMKQTGERPVVIGDCSDLSGVWQVTGEAAGDQLWRFEQDREMRRKYYVEHMGSGARGVAIANLPIFRMAWSLEVEEVREHLEFRMGPDCAEAAPGVATTPEWQGRDFTWSLLRLEGPPDDAERLQRAPPRQPDRQPEALTGTAPDQPAANQPAPSPGLSAGEATNILRGLTSDQ